MTDQQPEPAVTPARAPSEVLDPTTLDQALLVLVVRRGDGETFLSVGSEVDDAALAEWLRSTADLIEAGQHRAGCPACAAGLSHEHGAAE
jgi:hypothetical protein